MADERESSEWVEGSPERRAEALRRIAERSAANASRKADRPALPEDAGFEVHDPKYCLACGEDLSEFESPGECPRCGRLFDPGNPATFSDEPAEVAETPYWLQPPRLAGYGLLALVVLGRLCIHAVVPDWAGAMDGGAGSSRVGAAAGGVVGALLALLVIPWAVGCCVLGLIAAIEFFNPGRILVAGAVSVVLAIIITLGLPAAVVVMAVMPAPFAGLLVAWRST